MPIVRQVHTAMRKTILLLLAFCAAAIAQPGKNKKVAPDVPTANPQATVDAIVQYVFPPGQDQQNKVAGKGGQVKNSLGLVNALHVAIPASQINELAEDR